MDIKLWFKAVDIVEHSCDVDFLVGAQHKKGVRAQGAKNSRPAQVEIFNLCRNLHPHDVLFAECIRTFLETTIDGRAWMHRLEASQMAQTLKQQDLQTYVPPTRKPNVRTDRSRVNAFDAYGLRPLCHPWKLLSSYEFLRQWQVVPLLVPTHYLNRKETPRTEWTEEGKAFVKTKEYRGGKVAAKAGVHFIAVRNDKDGYYLYPEEPKSVFAVFRHLSLIHI